MKYLLDTHTFLWFINGDKALSATAQSLIEDPSNEIFLSIASIWEMAIKVSLGKLTMPQPFTEFVLKEMQENNINLINISPEHAGFVATLPFHHRDPFDRLIIAQALSEKIAIIGSDTIFDSYSVDRKW
jgi:PIN domain nuclease of toxin-antitoxin system